MIMGLRLAPVISKEIMGLRLAPKILHIFGSKA